MPLNPQAESLLGSSAVSAAVGGVFLWLANRKPKTPAEKDLDAVHVLKEVIEQLRDENERLIGRSGELEARAVDLDAKTVELQARTVELREEAHGLRRKVTMVLSYVQLMLGPYIAGLIKQLRDAGIEPAPMPPMPDLSEPSS